MAFSIGDATLTFLGDTSQLDQVFARIPGQAEASMSAATASATKLGVALDEVNFELDATAQNVPYAGETLKSVMEGSAVSVKTLGQQMVESGKAGTGLADAFRLVEAPAAKSDAAVQNMAFALTTLPGPLKEVGESAHGMNERLKVSEEMIGIHVPRGINRFLSHLPGLSSAINAAFAAGVVFFLADAIVQVADKLSHFIADTFIYTDVMKRMDAETAKTNQTLLLTAAAIKKANEQLEEFGMTAAQKTQLAIEKNVTAFANNSKAISENQSRLAVLKEEQRGWGAQLNEMTGGILNTILGWNAWSLGVDENTAKLKDNREEINKLENADIALGQKQKELTLQLSILSLQLRDQEDAARQQSSQKQNAFEQAKIKGSELMGRAMLAVQKGQADAEAAVNDESGAKRLLIDVAYGNAEYQLDLLNHQRQRAEAVRFENETYQLQLANLQNRVTLEKTMGAVGAMAARSTEAQIVQLAKSHSLTMQQEQVSANAALEALQNNHLAKTKEAWASTMATIRAAVKGSLDALVSSDAGFSKLEKDALKAAASIDKAFETLGVTPVTQLEAALKVATQAYNTLSKSGVASAHDLQKAYLAVLQTQRDFQKASGDVAGLKATDNQIEIVVKSLQKFEGETKKAETFWDRFSADFKKKAHDDGTATQQMGRMIGDSLKQMQQGFESAMAAAIMSSDSFVSGLEKETASALAQLSAQAAVKAIYFTAMGLAELATGFSDSSAAEWFAAAAEMGLVAGAAGAAGHAMAGGGGAGGGSSSGNAGSSAAISQNASTQAGGQPASSANVPHLFSGALVNQPRNVVVGDNGSGGGQMEGIFPLGSSAARDTIRQLFGGSGEGDTHIVVNVKGMLSTQDLAKTMRVVTRNAKTGRGRILSTDASRVTRRG